MKAPIQLAPYRGSFIVGKILWKLHAKIEQSTELNYNFRSILVRATWTWILLMLSRYFELIFVQQLVTIGKA